MTDDTNEILQKLNAAANEIHKTCTENPCYVKDPYATEALDLHNQVSDTIGEYNNRKAISEDRKGALISVLYERFKQDCKWGKQDHPFPLWLTILTEELGEASKEGLTAHFNGPGSYPNFRTELVQSAAVLLAMIECGDRNNWWDPK